jgi:hypothetical protein
MMLHCRCNASLTHDAALHDDATLQVQRKLDKDKKGGNKQAAKTFC